MRIGVLFATIAAVLITVSGALSGEAHKLAIHVDQNDPAVMNLALNNAQNVEAYYKDKGEDVTIEIVAYGPGLKMYTADSPVKDRISAMSLENDDIQFSACENTHRAMIKNAGKDVLLLSEAVMVPSGVVRLVELQEQGYSYVKP